MPNAAGGNRQPEMTLTRIAEHTDGYGTELAFSPDGHRWVSAGWGQFHVWDGNTLRYSVDLSGYSSGRVAFTADGRNLLVSPFVFDLEAQEALPLPPIENALIAGLDKSTTPRADLFEINGAAWSPEGDELIVYCQYRPPRGIGSVGSYTGPQKRLLVLDGRTRELMRILWEETSYLEYPTIAVSPEHIGAGGMPVLVWSRRGDRPATELNAHSTTIRDLAFSPDDARMASVAWDGLAIVWDTRSWQPAASWVAHEEYARAVAFHPTRQVLATGGGDTQLKLWDLTVPGRLLGAITLDGHVEGIAFHPQGEQLVAALDTGKLVVCRAD